MQHLNWDDLRVFVAVDRAGSFAKAAAALGLEPSTVGRRISRLEESLDARLFERTRGGPRITPTGVAIREHAAVLERAVAGIVDRAGANAAPEGRVRLATTDLLIPTLLRHLPDFQRDFPAIELDIVVSREAASIVAGEADLALRLKAPGQRDIASPTSVARRVASLPLSAWRHVDLEDRAPWPAVRYLPHDTPWIPGKAWTDGNLREGGLRTGSMLAALESAQRGIGVAVVLDCLVEARGLSELERVAPDIDRAELWLVQRADSRSFRRIREVVSWLVGISWADGAAVATG